MNKIKISGIQADTIAEELGIEAGDFLVSINGNPIIDVFDYRFYCADSELSLEIEKKDGERWQIDIEKDETEDLGLEFENSLIDEEKSCRNKCVFCFIDQLPEGMRDTLYFKDDDARLSFLFGNYITMTNLSYEEIERIIHYHMSPVNISVHTTNPELRIQMLNNRFAGDILEKIQRFTSNGITVNCQIVLCPDLNDGVELDRTIKDLTALYPNLHSISIVPVGLTKFRQGLTPLKAFDIMEAKKVADQVQGWQSKLLMQYGSCIVFLADELYILAKKAIPSYEHYEDFPQIENGVGMLASLYNEVEEALVDIAGKIDNNKSNRSVSIATGTSVYKYMKEITSLIEKKIDGIKIKVYPIENTYFGGGVTVTGLLTGMDIIRGLKGKELGEELLLCRNMFRSGTETMLDDITADMLKKELNVEIGIIDNNGHALIDNLVQI